MGDAMKGGETEEHDPEGQPSPLNPASPPSVRGRLCNRTRVARLGLDLASSHQGPHRLLLPAHLPARRFPTVGLSLPGLLSQPVGSTQLVEEVAVALGIDVRAEGCGLTKLDYFQ